MRNLRRMALALAAFGATFAVIVGPAMAREFTASRLPHPLSEAEPGTTRGRSIGEGIKHPEWAQEFTFGNFKIACKIAAAHAKTIGEGAVTWSTSKTFATEVKFAKCLSENPHAGFIGGSRVNFNGGLPVKFVYHINGFAELGTGETESEVEVSEGSTSFGIAGKECLISWPAQTVPAIAVKKPEGEYSAATYSTTEVEEPESLWKKFPSHFQQRLIIANEFKGMKYVYESGQCIGEGGFEEPAKKTEAKTGKYVGMIEEEVVGGNLGVTP
jgi:hypothetical protein